MTGRPGRYLVRLLVVAAVVAALVGLGYLWRSTPLASIVADGGNRSPRDRGRNTTFSLNNISDLLTTLLIGIGVMCFVILVDKLRRRRRPIPRVVVTAQSSTMEPATASE